MIQSALFAVEKQSKSGFKFFWSKSNIQSSVLSATIKGTTSIPQNASSPIVTFLGSGGTPPYTFKYQINDGDSLSIQTSLGNEVSIDVPTTDATVYNYSLESITDSKNIVQNQIDKVIVSVNALPDATLN